MWCVVMMPDREKKTLTFLVEPDEVTKAREGYRLQAMGIVIGGRKATHVDEWKLVGGPFRSLAAAYGCLSTETAEMAELLLGDGK